MHGRRTLLVLALALLLLVAGCGGDDEESSTAASTTPTEAQPTETVETEIETETVIEPETTPTTPTDMSGSATSPEDAPGGAGDAEPARTLAQFTGKGGQIRPRVIRVPPFIAIRVELRSADGAGYSLDFGNGKAVTTSPQVASSSTEFDGLRAGEELIGKPLGGRGNAVRVSASAEPGP